MEQKQPIKKPWATSKRIKVTALLSLGIFLLALIIGSSLYAIGSRLGIFPFQSLARLVKQDLLADPQFIAAVDKSVRTQPCRNEVIGFELRYLDNLKEVAGDPSQKCLSFTDSRSPQAKKPVVTLQHMAVSKNLVIDNLSGRTEQPVVDDFQHPLAEVSLIIGSQQGLPYRAYVIQQSPTITWLVELQPALGDLIEVTDELVRSLRFTPDEIINY